MTQAAARIFGWSSKKTMSVAQKLYEEGLITYHRTDSLSLSASAVSKVREYIKKEFGEKYLHATPRFYKTQSKVAQEAHEAIRPTNVGVRESGAGHQDFDKLYDLIWRRFVACQMSASVFDETVIDVAASKYLLRASGQIMKFDGWTRLRYKASAGQGKDDEVTLPDVAKDEELKLIDVWGDQKFTQPPARYNEASLIKTLEKLGIGRPSTYAPTISTIQVRNYVEKNESRQFIPTNIGIAVNDFLIENFPETFDYQFTAKMEGELDDIANGDLDWQKPIKEFYSPFEKKLKDVTKNSKRVKIEVEKLGKKCPECKKGELVIRIGRFGKFVSCSRFPDCKFTDKYVEKVGMKCPDCKSGDVIVKKTGKGRQFFGCSRYPECKWASWKNPKPQKEISAQSTPSSK
jgi:DNA topoisomerase-1